MKNILKNIWTDFRPALILLAITIPLCITALIWVAHDKPTAPIRLTLPAPGEVTACYVIPDQSRPYEQDWLGGEQLEKVLTELADTEFTEAEEAPDEGALRAALVIATNEEQITVQYDENLRAWVFYEGRWLICAAFAEGVSHEKDTDSICTMVTGTQESQETAAEKVHLDFSDVQIREGYYITEIKKICEQVYFDEDLFEVVLDYVENIEFQTTSDVPDKECFVGAVVISYYDSDIPLSSNTEIFWDENHRAWVFYEGRWLCELP